MILGAIVLALIIGVTTVKATPSYFSVHQSDSATTTVSTVNPATNVIYNLSGEMSVLMADVDSNYVFLQATASSTATTISWVVQYSNNNIDWFESDNIIAPAAGQAIVHASSTNTWTPGVTTISRKMVTIPTISSYYKRVVFGTTVGTSTIWIQDTAKRNAN